LTFPKAVTQRSSSGLKSRVLVSLLIVTILTIDQILKIWIKTNFTLGDSREVLGKFFQLHFVENYGMAFGLEFGGGWGKLILTFFRLVLIGFLIYFLHNLLRSGASWIVLICLSMILAGALGNIIDSVFYGVIFSASDFETVAVIFPSGGGYGKLFHGRVVDMLYFEIINLSEEDAPSWFPEFLFEEDGHFVFFSPVFNLADASITSGLILGLLFRR